MTAPRFPLACVLQPATLFALVLALPLALTPLPAAAAAAQTPDRNLPGEDMSDPLWIDALPWVVTGNTCDYEQDYDEMCPYGSWSPDVVYAFAPQWDMVVTVDMCSSFYDTKLLVYKNGPTGHYACSDDACIGPNYPAPYLSRVEDVLLAAGNTYYFVAKGYGAECGVYIMKFAVESPCAITFPHDGLIEGEPECHDGYVDEFNGGCDAQTPAFQQLTPGGDPLIVCGTSGTFTTDFVPCRDTDWYAIALAGRSAVSLRLAAEFDAKLHIFDASGGCDDPILIEGTSSEACDAALAIDTLAAGNYWLRVSPMSGSEVPCGARYLLAVEAETDAAAVEPGGEAGVTPKGDVIRIAVAPQPARGRADILLTLPRSTALEVTLFDPAGRCIRTLLPWGGPVAGQLRLAWDGRDEQGRLVPSGVYSCHVSSALGGATSPLLLLQ
jgi:hypothetical protein